jgi:4-amino-4-deoxy-L-arabinose transferase-like glycosyltransferase
LDLTPRQRTLFTTLLLVALLYLCFFYGLSSFGFVGPDEPRYAAIARDMAASGDWVTPRLQGHPWFEKPVLYYWSAGLAYKTFSNDEVAARMPSGVFALLAVLAMAWAARRFYGDRCALAVLLMLPTCAGMIGFARAAATDMPFAACLTMTMVAASLLVWGDDGGRWKWAAVFGFCLGLAVLAKGPAALVLCGGSIALWVVATRRWRDSLRFLHPLGILLFCATALPWYALCSARNPEFLRVFLLEHNFERFLTNRYQHAQPLWFFVPILLIGLFPWTILLGACARDAAAVFRERRWRESPAFFFGCWALFPFVFFSASQSKLPGYILPVIPPLVLLTARSLTRAPGFLALPGRPIRAVATLATFTALLVAPIVIIALPRLDAQISPRAAARASLEHTPAGKNLQLYRLPRAWAYGMNYYLGRELPEWSPHAEGAAPAPQDLWIVTGDAGRKDLEVRHIRPVFEQRISGGATLLHIEAK